ncbi:MAG TPA: Holliday junction branch migration protein RuvA [Stellaceae bacterium]|nr:Holliday junction branch migration protein RuvA [Stellaceae bacterium]
MIASLAGVVDHVGAESAVVDVHGVGYLVFASSRTLGSLPPRGAPVRLLIETHVREDHIHLYGFADESERDWFRLLTTVQGVGAKTGLAILAVLTTEALTTAVLAQDKAALTRADGVGPKLAQRVLSELKDKVGNIALGPYARSGGRVSDAAAGPSGLAADAVSALVNLGYPRSDAFTAVNEAQRALGAAAQFDALVRASLKELAR